MYLTLIHMGGGGTEEIAHAWATLGPFTTVQVADDAGQGFYNRVARESDQYRREIWHSIVEIPDPRMSMSDAADKFLADLDALTK